MDQGVPPRTPTLVTLGQRLKPPYPVQKHTGEACTSRRRLRAGLCGITETERAYGGLQPRIPYAITGQHGVKRHWGAHRLFLAGAPLAPTLGPGQPPFLLL